VAKAESFRHALLSQVCLLPKSSQALGQLVGEVHTQNAWRKVISLMKSFAMAKPRPNDLSSRQARHLSIAQLLHRVVTPPSVKSMALGDVHVRKANDVQTRGTSPTDLFETQVFRFLARYQRELELREVRRFRNQLIDGALVLTNGTRVALEVKYQLGWDTACRSNWQIEWFLRRYQRERNYYRYGLVIFGAFSGDWKRLRRGRAVGWDHWYRGHAGFNGRAIRISLVQFARGKLRPYPRTAS